MSEPTMIALRVWIRSLGISATTAWRWQKRGWISPVNICGKLYLTAADRQRFEARAAGGEFCRPPAGAARVKPTSR
jgi:hypothetical protein